MKVGQLMSILRHQKQLELALSTATHIYAHAHQDRRTLAQLDVISAEHELKKFEDLSLEEAAEAVA